MAFQSRSAECGKDRKGKVKNRSEVQVSAQPPAKKTARQIEKETLVIKIHIRG